LQPSNQISGLAAVNNAELYYETAGDGPPFVMIHAGVADNRQWNNEFAHFAVRFHVVRYDMRGYGKSEPVAGDFNHLKDLKGLLDYLHIDRPVILMGCSMGGGIAMDFALEHPALVRSLIMVGSAPTGLNLDVPRLEKFDEVERAFNAGDLDRVAELETQIWFDGTGRTPDQVDPAMRRLAYEMNHIALDHEVKGLGNRLPNTEVPAAARLDKLRIPTLVVIGANDTPYILAAADYMVEYLPAVQKAVIEDAAHLPNMEHPAEFQRIVDAFLEDLPT
jgi:pimeloyl-ACP methyl ester carboxylesterase